jgi:DoxX-like family
MLVSAMEFGLDPAMKGAFAHLGLPDWFRIELTVAKILGALALLIPGVPTGSKAFAYAGFTISERSSTGWPLADAHHSPMWIARSANRGFGST